MGAESSGSARPGPTVVVGPVLPFRGGIAQYNTLLRRTFGTSHATRFFSFTRQYPAALYPGNSDKDPDHASHVEPGVDYTIDSMNPLTWWRTVRSIRKLAPSIVIFHWWTFFWAPCFLAMIWGLKRRKIPIGLICHNIADHDANGFKTAVSRRLIGMADAYLVHSLEHAEILASDFPDRQVEYHPLPIYGHYPPAVGQLPKRGRLELLFFGFIRPYKGLDVLLEAMRMVADQSVHLTVVGEHWGDASAVQEAAAGLDNVELRLRYTSDQEAAEYFHRADFVVLPYKAATPSAVASLAYHYDTPIIASRVGGLIEVTVDGHTGILVAPCDASALADAIRNASREKAERMAHEVRIYKVSRGWDSLRIAFDRLTERSGRRHS